MPIVNWRFWEQKLSESPEKFENITNLRIAFPLLGIISSVSNQYLAQKIEVLCFFEQACQTQSYATSIAKNYVWTVQWNPHQDEHKILLPVELLLARTAEQFQAWLLSWIDTVQWPYHAIIIPYAHRKWGKGFWFCKHNNVNGKTGYQYQIWNDKTWWYQKQNIATSRTSQAITSFHFFDYLSFFGF